MTAVTDERMNSSSSSSNVSGYVEVATRNDAKQLRTGPVSDWLSRLASNAERQSSSSSSSSLMRGSVLSRFIQQVVNRTALCRLLNGTCVVPANCAVLGLTLGYDVGRGSSSDVGKYFSCDTSTICCYPFLLSSLPPLLSRGRNDVDDDYDLEGLETIYDDRYPRRTRQLPRRVQRKSSGRYGRPRRRYYEDSSRRRYRTDRRSSLFRRSLVGSPWNYFAAGYLADADGVNYTAVCESRGGMCVRAADCATNSAVDLTGTGSRYTLQTDHLGDSGSSDQIRSFLCNLTAICCLPQPTDTGGVQTADTDASLSQQVSGEFSSVLCRLVNGTCLPASRCVTSGVTSALYSRALNFRCNRTTVCCLG